MKLSKVKHSFLQTWKQALEGMGYYRSAQSVHRARSLEDYTDEARLWIQEIINIENDLRGTVQRETFVREELEALKAVPTLGNKDHIAKMEEELRILHWLCIYESNLYDSIVALCPENSFARGFLEWRRQPQWHLSPNSRRDCEGKLDAVGVTVGVARSHAALPGKRPSMGIVRRSVATAGGHGDDISSIQDGEGIGGLLLIEMAVLAFTPSIWRRVMFWVWWEILIPRCPLRAARVQIVIM